MRYRVVVLGGGYAGLAFLQGLRRESVPGLELTLVDRNPYHTLLTEAHTVAAGSAEPHMLTVPFSALGSGVRVLTASIHGIDRERRLVQTDEGALPFDLLVFCLGGADNDFGIPGVHEHALFLRNISDAERIRDQVSTLNAGGRILIVGGGLTGVELAAEMASHWQVRRQVTLVEAAGQILHGLPADLQSRARRRLGWLGVNVLTGTPVTRLESGHVHLGDGSSLAADLVIWATGVRGHALLRETGLPLDRSGRVGLDPFLGTGSDDLLVLGDSAIVRPAPGLPPLPPSGQLSSQMGFAAAANVAFRLRGREPQPFHPQLQGVLCDLGGLNASGLVFRLRLHGWIGAVAKRFTVLRHLWETTGLTGFLLHLRQQATELFTSPRRADERS